MDHVSGTHRKELHLQGVLFLKWCSVRRTIHLFCVVPWRNSQLLRHNNSGKPLCHAHYFAGVVVLLFILLSWWTLGAVVAYCRGIAASAVRAHYFARGTGTSMPRRALVTAASQLLQKHIGRLLGLVILSPVSWCLKAMLAMVFEEIPSTCAHGHLIWYQACTSC